MQAVPGAMASAIGRSRISGSVKLTGIYYFSIKTHSQDSLKLCPRGNSARSPLRKSRVRQVPERYRPQ